MSDRTRHFGECEGCAMERPLTKDHIKPKSKGGTNHPSNIQWLCQPCNEEKADSQCWVPPKKRRLWAG